MVGPFFVFPDIQTKSILWSFESMKLPVCPHMHMLRWGEESQELLGFLLYCIRSEYLICMNYCI